MMLISLATHCDANLFVKFCITFALIINLLLCVCHAGKVLELGDKLPELSKKHPEKNWLIKFYAPWCHHCQQLEPTYNNVAERIYHKHDHLIVGRVDCTKYGSICEDYKIDSYPTIMFVSKDFRVKYKSDRSEDSMIAFAERLNGPSINFIRDCDQLKSAVKRHQLIVLSTHTASTDSKTLKTFESLAKSHKANYWFYQISTESSIGSSCNNLKLDKDSIYVLKRHLYRSIKISGDDDQDFIKRTNVESQLDNHDGNSNSGEEELERSILKLIEEETFPIYGPINSRNIERSLGTNKFLVIAILDEYKPARRFAANSKEFHAVFEKFTIETVQDQHHYDKFLFGWSSDLELIEYITLTAVRPIPNVMILNKDFSYHLIASPINQTDDAISTDLNNKNLKEVLSDLKSGRLTLSGGNTYAQVFLRHTLGYYNKFMNMYRANPLLVSLLVVFPSLIIIFVLYTTCSYEDEDELRQLHSDDDEEYSDDDINQAERQEYVRTSNGHFKQD